MGERDNTDLLTDALQKQSEFGNLVLRQRVWINGIAYDPATYILQHVGPAPEPADPRDGGKG